MSNLEIGKVLATAFGSRILVIGDAMLDVYEDGPVSRLSPEAPVPIVLNPRRRIFPGGAANVAENLRALGADVRLLTIVGEDATATELSQKLTVVSDLIIDTSRPTPRKHRILAAGKQVARYDRECADPINSETEARVIHAIHDLADQIDVVVLSDYGKGLLTKDVLGAISQLAKRTGVQVICDPAPSSVAAYGKLAAIKPNLAETRAMTGIDVRSDTSAEMAMARLFESVSAELICMTRGGDGLSVARRGGEVMHLAAIEQEVFDVVGAGDCALAGLVMGLASKAADGAAARLALIASGLSVGRSGTSIVGVDKILDATAQPFQPETPQDVEARVHIWRAGGQKIGFTNGCFDVLHPGHIASLKAARRACDRLVVALNSDASIARLKGDGRPQNMLDWRCRKLAALGLADAIVAFDADTPLELVMRFKPDVLIKGDDYALEEIVGAAETIRNGGAVVRVPRLPGFSSTQLLETLQNS